jgi:sec-independent protein translocase protein TatA
MNFGTSEMLLIVAVVFLLFGASRLPQLAKSLGQTRKAFKEAMREGAEDEKLETKGLVPDRPTPQISQLSDEAIMAEMRRRSVSRT